MAQVWDVEAFRSTLERLYPSKGAADWAEVLGLSVPQLNNLLARPRGVRLTPHKSEVDQVAAALDVNPATESWIVEDPELRDVRTYDEEHLTARVSPKDGFCTNPDRVDADRLRSFMHQFAEFCDGACVLGEGQVLELSRKGIKFMILELSGEHRYRDAARELGIGYERMKQKKRRVMVRRRFWLK